jgi:regulator of protease activity HflC (stomatin/prohibitin superfamily)
MMTFFIDLFRGRTRLDVGVNERVLVIHNGRITDILGPGEHRVVSKGLITEIHDLTRPQFVSKFERALMQDRKDLAEAHLIEVAAEIGEVVAVFRDGALWDLSRGPHERTVLWTDAGPWDVRRMDLANDLAVADEMRSHVETGVLSKAVTKVQVERGQVGLLTIGGTFQGLLEEGIHLFWNTGRPISARLIDTRWRAHDVTGQEVLTADRVTVRVNIAADVRVADPVKAATAVKDFDEALHRALQFAFRKTLGTRTLDQLLAEKVSVDAEAADKVRAEMAEIGLEVGEIALKDVILPGEMREILNQVVAAEKAAEANVIRRREETNATRALLNTAKVMAENPVMLRLKELEALQDLAGKVDKLTVHNGTAGLMNDLVRLRDET